MTLSSPLSKVTLNGIKVDQKPVLETINTCMFFLSKFLIILYVRFS